jgi:hypothetical protein
MSSANASSEIPPRYIPHDLCMLATQNYSNLCNDLFHLSYHSRGAINACTIAELTAGAQELMRTTCVNVAYCEDTRDTIMK